MLNQTTLKLRQAWLDSAFRRADIVDVNLPLEQGFCPSEIPSEQSGTE